MKTSKAIRLVFHSSAVALFALGSLTSLNAAASSAPRDDQSSPASAVADAPAASIEVKIDNFAFTPTTITIKPGTQVTWTNHDDIPHTVDSTQGKFKSAALDTDDKFQVRFTDPGEYPFFCRIHPKMTGKIIVQP